MAFLEPRHEELAQRVRAFADEAIRPIEHREDDVDRLALEILAHLGQAGLTAYAVPAAYGGALEVLDVRSICVIRETLAHRMGLADFMFAMQGLGSHPIYLAGTEAQKQTWLPKVARGEAVAAFALTEPEAGSDVAAIRTTCRKEGDHWVLNGTKLFITNGARASWNVVFATIDPALGRAGHRVFVVERGTPGFTVGRIMEKMGLRASETAELIFDECRVPAENLLGGEERYRQGEGFRTAMQTFDGTRPMVAAMAVGIGRAAYEYTRDRLREELTLSRPIPRYGVIAERLSWMERELHAARLLVWQAASMADQRIPNSKEASMAKAYAGTVATRVCAAAVELLGAVGLRHDRWVEKWFRDIKVFDIFEGTGQVQRLVVARRLFEPYGLRV